MTTQSDNTEMSGKPTLEGESLPDLLRRAREASGLSQTQVAERLNDMGEPANQGSVQKAESGEGPQKLEKILREAKGRGYRLVFKLVPLDAEGASGVGERDRLEELEDLIRRFEPLAQMTSRKLRDFRDELRAAKPGPAEKKSARRSRAGGSNA